MNESPDLKSRLQIPLLLLRLSAGLFFLQWSVEKIIKPEATGKLFEHFYSFGLSVNFSQILGALEVLLALAILIGFKRKLVYGAAFVMHAGSTLATWQQLIDPYTGGNHLFVAAIPLLAALWLLFRWMLK